MPNTNIEANSLDFKHIGWKSYNNIIKKAVEQEFSWSGLVVSLSIAFFIVILSAFALNLMYETVSTANKHNYLNTDNIYHLETIKYLPVLQQEYLNKSYLESERQLNHKKLLYLKPVLA